MAGIQIDGVNNKIDFDDDLDTSISANTDDTLVIEAGGVNIASITAGEFAINEGSADVDFRVESNGNTHMLFVDGGNDVVGIGTSSPNFPLDVVSDSSANGIQLRGRSADNIAQFSFESNDSGTVYSQLQSLSSELKVKTVANIPMSFHTNNSEVFRMHTNGSLSNGAETAPDTAVGLCLNQAANDGRILTFKSSDVAHGVTNDAETDTYFSMQKASGAKGGLVMKVLAEDMDSEVYTMNIINTADLTTTKSRTGLASVIIGVNTKGSGTSTTFANDNGNLFCVRNYIQTKFIVDAEGELHADGSATVGTFDSYEDAQLVRAFDLSHMKGVINSKFDEYVKYKHEDLAEAGIVGREEDGTPNHMINVTGLQRLHNGAIWQQYEKTERLASAFYKLAKKTIGKEEADKLLTEEEIQLLN